MEMRTPRFLRIAIPVVGALLVAGGAIAITASAAGLRVGSPLAATATPSPKPSAGTAAGNAGGRAAACQAYLGHLATQLGVSQSKLDAASAAALKATIQDQVTNGKLTQAQADKIEAKLPATGLCSAAVNGLGRTRAAAAAGAYLTAAAGALGVTEAELRQDLKNGQTLSQVAAAKNVTEADFKAKVVAALKTRLDAAVSAKTITQAQEDAQLAKLQAGDPPLWNKVHK
ncbi:MAG TPA: hypothetical protein DDW26_04960 [Rhizobiales bacterium]|jgi:hypothetical protein|nr:hypothetical protein [Hyphomicrobiales bacterium]